MLEVALVAWGCVTVLLAVVAIALVQRFIGLCNDMAVIRRILSEKFESTPTPDPSANTLKLLSADMGFEGGDRTVASVHGVDKDGNTHLVGSFEVKNYPPKVVDD